jgi:hypothetical protein
MNSSTRQQDRALKYLDIVRAEFRQRIELKQQVLTAYVLGVAAIFGFVIQGFHTNPRIINLLWLVPLLSLSAAAFFGDHMMVSTSLSQYVRDYLEPLLDDDGLKIQFWDRADTMESPFGIFGLLNVIESAIVCFPTCAIIVLFLWPSRRGLWLDMPFEIFLMIYAFGCLCLSVWLLVKMSKEAQATFGPRKKLRKTK